METRFNSVLIMLLMGVISGGCKKDINKLTDCNEVSLKSRAPFEVGVAVESSKVKNKPAYREKVLAHFSSITPENAMKFAYLMPQPNVFDWSEADYLVDFTTEKVLKLHGHTLIWGEHNPEWLNAYTGDWQQLFKEYIQTVVGRYKGKVHGWDVVNEVLEDDGSLKNNIWKEKLGENYISLAFEYAQEADPSALLFINEVNLESKIKKLTAAIFLANKLKSEGRKVDGIGLQMHVSYNFPADRQIENAMKFVSGAGLKVHVSELDVAINNNKNLSQPSYHTLKEQKKRVNAIVKAYNDLPPESRYGITLWGLSDADSWLQKQVNPNEWPLLFDKDLNIKPCFCGFLQGLE